MKRSRFLDRLHVTPFGLRAGFTFCLLLLESLLIDVLPWVDTAGRRLFVRFGFAPAEAAFLTLLGVRSWLSGLVLLGVLLVLLSVCWLVEALVFHVRGRVWGPMIGHPLGNRLNAVLFLLRAQWVHVA